MAAAVEAAWRGPLEGPGRHALRPWRAVQRDRGGRGRHPVPDAAGAAAAARILERVRPWRRRPGAVPDLGRRLGAAGPAGAGPTLADKQAVNRALLKRRRDRRDQLRPQASLGDQGRAAGGRGRAGAGRHPGHFRRAGRRSGDDRLGADRARSDDAWPTPRVLRRYAIARRAVVAPLTTPPTKRRSPAIRASPGPNVSSLTPRLSLAAAAAAARAAGRDAARSSATRSRARRARSARPWPDRPPGGASGGRRGALVLLSGGETTVTVRGKGRGGRNAGIPARPGLALDGAPGIQAIACDTDGSTAARTMPARSRRPTRWRAPPRSVSSRARAGRQRRLSVSSPRSATCRHRADADQRQRLSRHPDRADGGALSATRFLAAAEVIVWRRLAPSVGSPAIRPAFSRSATRTSSI